MAQNQPPYNPYYGQQQQPQYQQPPPYGSQQQAPPYGFQQQAPQQPAFFAPAQDAEAQFVVKHENLQFDNVSVRAAFVRKVFMLLTFMLSIVVAMIALFVFEPNCKRFVRTNIWPYYLSFGVFLVTYIAIICCESVRRNFPGNMICLLLLTSAMGYMTAMISSFYDTSIVFMAMVICSICCAAIMIFACQTKYDFTSWIGVMFIISMVMMLFGIMAILCAAVFKTPIVYVVYASLMALVFMVYLAIDTQMLIGGKRYEYSPEDYIVAAIQLFLDIIYIFIYILQIIGYLNKKD
uniref:Uncharacterized protein n=1 Tax=Romanomermis culicivorax TaxID=13658 RepID=A0A915JCX2_ROMCU